MPCLFLASRSLRVLGGLVWKLLHINECSAQGRLLPVTEYIPMPFGSPAPYPVSCSFTGFPSYTLLPRRFTFKTMPFPSDNALAPKRSTSQNSISDPYTQLKKLSTQDGATQEFTPSTDGLHRGLGNRQLQLVGIGASIGTGMFISIGASLYEGGPGNLLLAFIIQNMFLAMVNNSAAEMSTYMPLAGGFIRLAGKWVDDALGFAAGWNFFIHQVIVVPFEIVALSMVLSYWSDEIPVYAIVIGCIVIYV